MKARVLFFFGVVLSASTLSAATYVVPADDVFIRKADAIVIARALHSHAEDSDERGIETVTVFAIEDILKSDGAIRDGFTVRIPGGVLEDEEKKTRFKVIPGAPRFIDGDRVLLFVNRRPDGNYATTDFGLGLFGFSTDNAGRQIVRRTASDITGWDIDGSVHRERVRDAELFMKHIRDVVASRPASAGYVIATEPVDSAPAPPHRSKLRTAPETCSGCTVLQYTLPLYAVGFAPCNSGVTATDKACVENGPGARWPSFPTAVNWNRGSAETNVTNSGSDAINTAFSSWNGDANSNVNYVLTTTTANVNGIFEAADSVNNIVFEKDMSASGIPNYSCAGGVLGLGGVASASSSGQTTVEGQSFYRTTEGDVSMNKGVGACIPASLSVGNFNSSVTHEVGHTLGFRHSDKTRENSDLCTTIATYDCSSSAIMTAVITSGLSAALQTWDASAVARLYPASTLAAPASITATASSSTSVAVTWSAVSGVTDGSTQYQVFRSSDRTNFTQVCTATAPTVTCTDTTALANTSYLYKARASATGAFSVTDVATTTIFTDPTLTTSTKIRAVHLTELRTAVNALRKLANSGVANDFNFTDPSITVNTTKVRAVHINDLRTALDAARSSLSLTSLSYTDPTITAGTTKVRMVHISELRAGVQ